jgi:23S rRNA pseudouridine1911/1915/1917 synthase
MEIVMQHADWLVAFKPANQLIHPTRPDSKNTFWHELIESFPNEKLSIINRLDRETSGLVLVSRNSETASILGKMTMARSIRKEYLALVFGKPLEQGTINTPLDRLGKHQESKIYLKQGIILNGNSATTHYQTIETRAHSSGSPISLVKIELETGRLHQIRVHMASIGHFVIGDKIYGADENCYLQFIETGWTPHLESKLWLNRHALHAHSLSFEWEKETQHIELPLATDLLNFWNSLLPSIH